MIETRQLAFLLDVDNTLLDNDCLKRDIASRVLEELGSSLAERFWTIYEEVRGDQGYVDYPTTIQRLVDETGDSQLAPRLLMLVNNMDFQAYLYPGALEAISHMRTLGTVAILSDGDRAFQPHKIEASGLKEAVHGNVLISVHKEKELSRVFARYPAEHYVMVDDKPGILAALERECPTRFTTILVLQGKYARMADYARRPDLVVPHIGDLANFSEPDFLGATGPSAVP